MKELKKMTSTSLKKEDIKTIQIMSMIKKLSPFLTRNNVLNFEVITIK